MIIGKKSFGEQQLLENYLDGGRRDPEGEAELGEGPLHQVAHALLDDGPGRAIDPTRPKGMDAAPIE